MFPYEKYKGTELWDKIERIILDLEENRDLTITTAREYVVGYFCERITETEAE
jgi:hypothetical protein